MDQLQKLISRVYEKAPAGSLVVVEAEVPFEFAELESIGEWDVRVYRPAVVGVLEKIGR